MRLTLYAAPIIPLLLFAGCQSGFSLSGGPFAKKERTSYQTPKVRMENAIAVGRQATGQDTPEQQQMVVDLARQIQTEPDPLVRAEIISAAGKFNTPLAAQVLSAGLQDTDALVRKSCCEAIGKRGDATQSAALAEVIRSDNDLDVQIEAVRALGNLKSPETATALIAALEADDPAIQYAGVQSMKRATGQDLGGDVRAYLAFAKGEAPPVTEQKSAVASRLGRFLPF